MTDSLVTLSATAARDLLGQRRSVRALQDGPLPDGMLEALGSAIDSTPAAFGMSPWQVVLLHERRGMFWDVVERSFREHLTGEQLDRYLTRLDGFRPAVVVAMVYEDLSVRERLVSERGLSSETGFDFALQGLGMVQLGMWLAATGFGLGASLQHWDWMVEAALAEFAGLPQACFRLVSVMPFGHPAEDASTPAGDRPHAWVIDPRTDV